MSLQAVEQLLNSKIFSEWHWFNYHFRGLPTGYHTTFSFDFLNKMSLIERHIPGFTTETIKRMSSLAGREKYEPHYEQLLQLLVEVVIFYRLSEAFLGQAVHFTWEPTTRGSDKNPELKLSHNEWEALIEIKCPSMFAHLRSAATHDTQLGARLGDPNIFDEIAKTGHATRPLDNKIKDFLISANGKFQAFRDEEKKPFTLLIIAWSQYLFEATSPLVNGMSGLFTENSFYKNKNGMAIPFPAVDGVLVTEHLELVLRGTREAPLPFGYLSPLHFGAFGMLGAMPPAYIHNPAGNVVSQHPVLAALGAMPIAHIPDPRVQPLDYVMWLN